MYTSNEWKQQNRKMLTRNQLDLESLGSWPKNVPGAGLRPMSGKNRRLVADGPVGFEKWPVEVEDLRRITDRFRGIYGISPNEWKQQIRKMSTCSQLDLESLESWPTMSKNFPGTGT